MVDLGQSLLLFSIALGVITHDPGKQATPGELIAFVLAVAGLIIACAGAVS